MLDSLKGKIAAWLVKGLGEDTWRRRIVSRLIIMEANKMQGSWQMKVGGIAGILAALALLGKGIAESNMAEIGSAISALIPSITVLFARQNNKSSEDVGIK